MSEAVEVLDVEAPSTEIERHVPAAAVTVTPELSADDLVKRLDIIRDASERAMQQDVDYGVIPGTGSKPTLLKPGAEKLAVLFQLDVQLVNEKIWGPGDHLTVMSRATVFHAPTGQRLGFGEGTCSTKEKKYGKRKQERTCPNCGKAAIIKGKAEYGGGWVCFKKKDGCGAKYRDEDTAITEQSVGEVENPDLADTWNTVVKMAEKRARVDAVLAVTGASALFTQDVEDLPHAAPTQPSFKDVERTQTSDITPPLASREQKLRLSQAYNAANKPADITLARMDEFDVPAGPDVASRVALLTDVQAEGLIEFLESGLEDPKATA